MSFMITACVPATAPRNAPRSRKPIFVEPDDGVYEECVPGAQLRREDHSATGCHIGYIFKKTLQSCIRPQEENDKKLSGEYKSYERPEETESMILDNALFEPKQPPGSIGSSSDTSKISTELSLSSESTTTGPMAKFARTASTRKSISNSSGSAKSKSPPGYGLRPSGSPELDAIVNSMGSSPEGSPNSHHYLSVNSDEYESAVLLKMKSNPSTDRRQMVPNKKPDKSISLPPSGKLWGKSISSDWKSSLKDPFRSKKKFAGPSLEKVYELPEKEALYDVSRDPVLKDLARVAREVKEAAKDRISAEETYPGFVSQPSIRSKCSDVSRRLNSFSVAARLSPSATNRCASRNLENHCLDNVMASLTLSDSSGSQKQLLSPSSDGRHKVGEIDIRDDGIIYSIEKVRKKGKRPVEMNPVPLCVPGMQGFVPPYCRVSAVRARRALLRRHNSKASRGSKTFSDTTWASSEARRKRRLKPVCKGQDHYCRDVKVTPCVSTLRKKKNEFERARKRANVGANKGARKKAYVFNWLLVNQGVIGNPAEKERARRLAKERSTLLWLLSKAYKGRVPTDLRSPHYKESGNQYRLKPDIVDLLTSCKIYCMVLRGIYEDPSYCELSFGQILVMLARKGIEVKTLKEGLKITPRILEECSPLNMLAHLHFADALMELFIREILIPSKVCQVVQRFANSFPTAGSAASSIGDAVLPIEFEDAALLWINRSAQSLREKVHTENREILPKVVHAQDLSDLSDGSALACLISLYCPQHLSYYDINFLPSMSLAESLANHQLIKEFCERHLPQDVHFVTMEDLLFPHATIRTNILVFIADLMYLFEIKPCKVVQVPGIAQYVVKRESNKEIPITAL